MARGGRGSNHQPRRPVDLTGIISLAEKNDLITLVTAISEKMGTNISDIFDSPPISPANDNRDRNQGLMLPLTHDKENQPTAPKINRGSRFQALENPRPPNVKAETEIPPQLRELKKESMLFFRKWQTNLLQRMRDLIVNEPGQYPASLRGRGRGAPRGGLRGGMRGQDPRDFRDVRDPRDTRDTRGGRGGRGGRGNLTLSIGPPRLPSNYADRVLAVRFTPVPNPLWTLDLGRRKLLLHIVFLLLLSLQEFTANARILLLHLASSLNLHAKVLQDDEVRIAQGLAQTALDVPLEQILALKPEENKGTRRWKLGLSYAAGTPVKLAAPLLAAGIGIAQRGFGLSSSAAAGLLGTMADNGILIGVVFGISVAKPTSKIMDSFTRDISDFALLSLHTRESPEYRDARSIPAQLRRLRVAITVNGFLMNEEHVVEPWRCMGHLSETFVTRWESSTLYSLGNSLETVIKSCAWKSAKDEMMGHTIYSNLMESNWPKSLLKISKIMDNPWSVGMVRCEKAGAVLADAIMRQKFQGDRPVSLIGYSLGARAIYTCLMVLAERRQFGLVDSVVMIGTPAPAESRVWLTLKSVVSGRLVNVYSENDYILGFLYRTSNIHFGVAGLQEIQGADGVESYRVHNLPKGHLSYQDLTGPILRDIGWEDLSADMLRSSRSRVAAK